jgi:AcrR family transcriptional regulator
MNAPAPRRGDIFTSAARGLGKSERTRARLMDAAVSIFARDGFEAASVNEIAQTADVANGTFYLHFRDKEAIAGEVAFRIAANVAGRLDAAMVEIDDAVERVAFATRQFINLASSAPDWGWALFRAAWALTALREQVTAYVRADLQRGHRQGVFKIPIDPFLVEMFASMVMAALYARLQGTVGDDAGSRLTELQLRMLGVAPARAKRVAWRRLEGLVLQGESR